MVIREGGWRKIPELSVKNQSTLNDNISHRLKISQYYQLPWKFASKPHRHCCRTNQGPATLSYRFQSCSYVLNINVGIFAIHSVSRKSVITLRHFRSNENGEIILTVAAFLFEELALLKFQYFHSTHRVAQKLSIAISSRNLTGRDNPLSTTPSIFHIGN